MINQSIFTFKCQRFFFTFIFINVFIFGMTFAFALFLYSDLKLNQEVFLGLFVSNEQKKNKLQKSFFFYFSFFSDVTFSLSSKFQSSHANPNSWHGNAGHFGLFATRRKMSKERSNVSRFSR